MPISSNKYTIMQKAYYDNEGVTGNMNRENHCGHNANPDYWEILVKDSEDPEFLSKVGLDFACGCGRNVINLINRFKRMDGVDISPELIKETDKNLKQLNFDDTKYKLYTCNGVSLDTIESNTYDFVMTTIALQHICVYDIRLSYFKEFFRVMRSGGILSFQMGFGNKKPGTVKYYENYYDATSTNSGCDVRVEDPNDIINDLKNIGFKNITYQIRNSWDDGHHEWIYLRAIKP
jgi:ubiquinone/menaquinone biosynthesis C-methylase UbiE